MKLLLLFLFVPFIVCAQQKQSTKEFGPVTGVFLNGGGSGNGASFSIRGQVNKNAQIGFGTMPIWNKGGSTPQVPVFLDFRIAFSPNISMMLQPGYNIYSNEINTGGAGNYIDYKTKGGLYGGGGFSFHIPSKTKAGAYVQVKYNYFGNTVQADYITQGSGSSSATTGNKAEAVTIGAGLRF